MASVLQEWVQQLTFMQQSVLMAAVRGPDGIHKNHVAKLLCRWLRRCFLITSFEKVTLDNPAVPGGGSFTGPSLAPQYIMRWEQVLSGQVSDYLMTTDEIPHHFQLHFIHAAEILGYKHPKPRIRGWWLDTYHRLVSDMHLNVESEVDMDRRLGDNEQHWRDAEEVSAALPR